MCDPREWVFEPFDGRPYDIFVLRTGSIQVIGRRHRRGAGPRRTGLVDASMLLGRLERVQVLAEGVAAFFTPLPDDRRRELFREIATHRDADLYYPFPALSRRDGREWCTPSPYWTPSPQRVRVLNDDEALLRERTIAALETLELTSKVVFDPACSTGAFLEAIKARFPSVVTVGQDRCRQMVAFCRDRVDHVYVADAAQPAISEESTDVVLCRFLNFHVVATREAHNLFVTIAKCCRIGGHILVAGYTPVLLSAEWFEILGLRVLRRIAYFEDRNAACQFYWLRREGAIRDVSLTTQADRH